MMTDKLIVNRGLEDIINTQPHQPGAIWLTEDGQNLYLDSGVSESSDRIQITDIIDLSLISEESRKDMKYYPNKIYIENDECHTLKRFNKSTGNLEIISNLANKLLVTDSFFIYDKADESIAELSDSSNPQIGTLVIDANNDVGIVTEVKNDAIMVTVISRNKLKLGFEDYDIYFDSNYNGQQVGTIDYPFNNWNDLYDECENQLKSGNLATIHIKSNSSIEMNDIDELRNVVFNGNKVIDIKLNKDIINGWENITFNNVTLNFTDVDQDKYLSLQKCNNIQFNNCVLTNIHLLGCENISFINNSNITQVQINEFTDNENIESKSKNISFNNVTVNKISLVDYESTVKIHNSNLTVVESATKIINSSLDITDTVINSKIYLNGLDNVMLNDGFLQSNGECLIKADQINIGTFNFNGVEPTLEGTINTVSGLSSAQVYDKNYNRSYGTPENNTIEAHLDKIGDNLETLNKVLGGDSDAVNPFNSKKTFLDVSEIPENSRIGDIFTYVNESKGVYKYTHTLELTNFETSDEYDYSNYKGEVTYYTDLPKDAKKNDVYNVQLNEDGSALNALYMFNGTDWSKMLPDNTYAYLTFTLDNASYYIKNTDNVDLLLPVKITIVGNADEGNKEIQDTIKLNKKNIYSVIDNVVTLKLKYDDLINEIKNHKLITDNLNDTEIMLYIANLSNSKIRAEFTQSINLDYKDRLLRLSNGWDKLSGSVDIDATVGNYHIVQSYSHLALIDTDDTREIGTLAYVQEDDQIYQWNWLDQTKGTKEWIIAALGGGSGKIRATLELDTSNIVNQHREDNTPFNLSVLLYKCTTGTLTCTYGFTDDTATHSKTVSVSEPNKYTFLIDNIEDRDGILRISFNFKSDDNEVLSTSEPLVCLFYIGNVLKINQAYLDYELPDNSQYEKKSYSLSNGVYVDSLTTSSSNLTINDFKDRLKIKYFINTVDESTGHKIRYTVVDKLRKNKDGSYKVLYTYEGNEEYSETSNTIDFPVTINGNENYLSLGYYEIQLRVYTNNITSEAYTLPFFVDSCMVPYSCIINYDEEIFSIDDNITNKLIILYNNKNNANLFNVKSYMCVNEDDNKCINDLIKELPLKDNNTNLDVHNITLSYENIIENISYDCYFKVALSDSDDYVSSINKKVIEFQNAGYMQIVRNNIMYSLNSRYKSNLSSTKDKWMSAYTSDNFDSYFGSDSLVSLNNFTFANDGWLTNTDENDDEVTTLTFDGDGTYATINMNPLLKNSSNYGFDNDNGFTFEIKFKAKELYKKGTVLQCLNSNNHGMLITDNEVVFSPYDSVYVFNENTQMRSKLTTNEWHTVTFVMLPRTSNTMENFYQDYFYNNNFGNRLIDGSSVAMLFIDGIISGLVINEVSGTYKEDFTDINLDKIYLGASYNKLDGVFNNSKMQIMHITCYNTPLSPDEILTNYIAYNRNIDAQAKLKTLNGYNNGFGFATDELIPVLTVSNAYLPALDAKQKNEAKNYVFPDVGINLTYKGIKLIEKYGCDLKVQGTSSLGYPIKNYKITHYNINKDHELSDILRDTTNGLDTSSYGTLFNKYANDYECKKQYQEDGEWKSYKKYPISVNGWLPEHTFTLKADFMESTHCRNVGAAMFANMFMSKVPPMLSGSKYDNDDELQLVSYELDKITNGEITNQEQYDVGVNVNPITKIQNAIAGFPCILQYEYVDSKGMSKTKYQGIYMFDVDKNAEFIFGYDKYVDNCKSYEISNNNADEESLSGAAGFNIDLINDTSNALRSLKNDIEIRYHGDEDNALNKEDETLKLGYTYTQQDDPTTENRDKKTKADELNEGVDYHSELKHFYMWLQDCINRDDDGKVLSYNYEKFKSEIDKHLDLDNILRYIILAKVLGLTDNLAKNLMITTWDAGTEDVKYIHDNDDKVLGIDYDNTTKFAKWYLQFYDLDTQTGLTNRGYNLYPVSLELNGHTDVFDNNGELISTKGLHLDDDEITNEYGSPAFKKAYNVTDITSKDRYNGANSVLWKLIIGAYDSIVVDIGVQNEIQIKYNELRNTILTLDNLKSFYFDKISNNIGQYYYNRDALNKYFGHNYASNVNYAYACMGSAKNHISVWLENRLKYWDSKYMYNSSEFAFVPYPDKVTTASLGINVSTPVYIGFSPIDSNIDAKQWLCTSEETNIISDSIGRESDAKLYNVNHITKLTLSNTLGLNSLDLNDCTELTSLDIGTLLTVSDVKLNSPVLQRLSLSGPNDEKSDNTKEYEAINLSTLDVSKLNELIELDVSNSNISTLNINTNIKRLNIENSKIKSLDLSTLKSLESLNKVDISKYTTASEFIEQLKTWRLISSNVNISNNSLTGLTNDDAIYISRLTNQFKNHLIKNNVSLTADKASDKLLIEIITKYKTTLGKQFIPNLAIIKIMNNYGKDNFSNITAFKDIIINSNNLKAIHFTYDKSANNYNLCYGFNDGNVNISGENIKYVYIDKIRITDGNIKFNLPKLEYMYLNDSTYSKPIDLSKSKYLQSLTIKNFKSLLGVIISDELRTNKSLKNIDFSNNYNMMHFIDNTQIKESNANITFDFEGLTLEKLNIYNVLGFTYLKNLNINNYNTAYYKLDCDSNASSFSQNRPIDAYVDNCVFNTKLSSISLSYLFAYRKNLNFKFKNNGLNIEELLKKCTSLNYAFTNCMKITYEELCHILELWKCTNGKSCSHAFENCTGIKIPYLKVTDKMFPKTMESVTDVSYMYCGLCNSNSVIINDSAFDNLINVQNIAGLFAVSNSIGYSIAYCNVSNDSSDIQNSSMYIYPSCIKQMPYDILHKCTKLTNIGQSSSSVSTLWAGRDNEELKITGGDFNEVLDKIDGLLTNYNGLFASTKIIKDKSNNIVTINKNVMKNAAKNTSYTSYNFIRTFTNCRCNVDIDKFFSDLPTKTINDSLIEYNMNNMFSNVKGTIKNFKPTLFLKNDSNISEDDDDNIIKVSNMSFMFASNYSYQTNMNGFLLACETDPNEYVDKVTNQYRTNYKIRDGFDNFSILYKQDKVTTIAGMFYNCKTLGGLKVIIDDDTTSNIREFSEIKDIPNTFFKDAVALENAAYLFNGCTNLNIWFDDLSKDNVYLFKTNTSLQNVSFMFKDSSLKHSLPTYGNKGSQLDDCKYFYYDITDKVKKLLDNKGVQYDLSKVNSYKDYLSDFEKIYIHNSNPNNNPDIDTEITIYQYYKECQIDDDVKYAANPDETHKKYLENNGFLYIDKSINPLVLITGLFKNTQITGGIPSNIFKNLENISNVNNVFDGCSYLGLTDIKGELYFRNNNNVMDVTPDYIIPYGLFDSCSNIIEMQYTFYNVYYLSRPYKTWSGSTGHGYTGSDRNDGIYFSDTEKFDEVYIIPKYFLHYLPNLQSCQALFWGSSKTNNLFGHLYKHMFEKNNKLTNLSYMFCNTHVYGCEEISNRTLNEGERVGMKYYIGEKLLSYLPKLNNVSYLFDDCPDLLRIVYVNASGDYNSATDRDLLFNSKIHTNSYLQTYNVIYLNKYYPNASAYADTHNGNIRLKLVHNAAANTFSGDKECCNVFINSKNNLTSYQV